MASSCANPELLTPRVTSNPLVLPIAPGFDPLHGAHFFVDGPAHGTVAKAIEQLIGDTTVYPDTESWATFVLSLGSGSLSHLIGSPALAGKVRLLEKIGDQEETNNLSEFSMGGGPGAIYAQTLKIMCQNMLADPTPDTVPVLARFRRTRTACSVPPTANCSPTRRRSSVRSPRWRPRQAVGGRFPA